MEYFISQSSVKETENTFGTSKNSGKGIGYRAWEAGRVKGGSCRNPGK